MIGPNSFQCSPANRIICILLERRVVSRAGIDRDARPWLLGAQPIVHGKFLGSFHLTAPLATKSCGTFLVFMYLWIAELVGVPVL